MEGKSLVCKTPSGFYGKRGHKYFPCQQWKRNLDLVSSQWREPRHPCLPLTELGEAGKREPWECSLEASLGRGMLSKEITEYCRVYFKKIEVFVAI